MQDIPEVHGPAVLVTRPRPAADRFAAELRAVTRAPILIAPVTAIAPLGRPVDTRFWKTLVFTSENAIGQAIPIKHKLAYCVGDRTAKVAKSAGFNPISAEGDAEALIAKILEDEPRPPILHLRGEESTGDIAGRLVEAGIQADEKVVYGQREMPLPPPLLMALAQIPELVVPVFSPRSAERLAKELEDHPRLTVVAISQAAANAWSGQAERIVIAQSPDADAVRDAVTAIVDPDSGC